MKRTTTAIILLGLFILAACQNEDPSPILLPAAEMPEASQLLIEETAVSAAPATTPPLESTELPLPTATPLPQEELIICVAREPTTLFLYGDTSIGATAVRHAVYENLITSLAYDYQARGVEKVPSLADGDALIQEVVVKKGDRVLNSSGDPVILGSGMQIITADGAFLTFTGEESEPVLMNQMVVEFELRPLIWSDGTSVTAVDSVFSFNLASEPVIPSDKRKVERTISYEAINETAVRWTGLPGFLDETYFLNVWTPLPIHQLSSMTAPEMATALELGEIPLSHGPFMVESWERGAQIVLARNPFYYQPPTSIGRLIFRFDAQGLDGVVNGRCHIALQDSVSILEAADIAAAADAGAVVPHYQSSLIFEHIDFGITPAEEYAETRPDWFADVRVRQAMTMCTDRQRMIDELMLGNTTIMHAYAADAHPLYPPDAFMQPFDPAAANALLDEVGLVDADADGIRDLVELESGQIKSSAPFSITLGTDDSSPLRRQIIELFAEDMQACGIHVSLYEVPIIDWYADGPFSPLFGRRFDLASFAWVTNVRPPCNLYLSRNITGPEEQGFGGWGNVNATGWSDEAYDAACINALHALRGTAEYVSYHQEAIRIFTEQLPIIPLFSQVKVAVTSPEVVNFSLDITEASGVWNLYEIDKDN